MTKESLTLSHQELNRLSLVESIIAKRITQHQAAIQLRLSPRQSYSQTWCMSHQAASLSCCCLMPSLNFTPVITSVSKLYPRNLCQRF
jgi:hypothetical protein